MGYLDDMHELGHEQVVFCRNADVGLRAIIAIHDTTLGPALGGVRMWPYKDEAEAFKDALRLARGMTYKAAAAGLNLGGGKAVIIGDPKRDKSEALFRAFGRFVETLGGRYITAEDVGTDVNDMEFIFMETRFVTGVHTAHGGSGDPSPVTAYGIIQGLKACANERFGTDSLQNLKVAVQGLGNVGFHFSQYLKEEGARIVACDIDPNRSRRAEEELGVQIVGPDEIYDAACDVFSPCALGAVLNDKTIPRLKCKVVAGGANNQLQDDRHGDELQKRGILYAPDYVINAGGLTNVYCELEGYNRERALRMTRGIFYNLRRVFDIAKQVGIPTYRAADRLAEERIGLLQQIKRTFVPPQFRRRMAPHAD